ncbi:MAG: non-heme iron oxygenase ferredoxin subunit [Candidatus Nitrosotenuis sp.]|jgi:nitrite reductase/ring-hydroxylating ferredoxin subunit|nr:non-heme iron oxygenase ferredoxin subunit [Candidatus Nitrosotenuis sp.]
MGKIIVGKTSEITPGKMQKVSVDGRDIVVANVNGTYYACDDTCTHAGASLAEGTLEGNIITCGWHGAKFNCTNGKLEKFPAKIKDLKSYRTVVEADNVFVEVG